MNRNVLIVLGGGFIIALVVALIVQAGLSGGKSDGTQVLVATRALEVGHQLAAIDVKWQDWPKSSTTASMVIRKADQKIDDAAKGQLKREVGVGEPILSSYLVSDGQGNVLAAALEPGMRAVAIKVKAESMVGGFISPGDRVDIIMAYDVRIDDRDNMAVREKIQKYAAETVLENVRVLAIDQQARKEDDKAKVGRTVTLEVNSEGAEKLNLAGTMGELALSLRPLGDNTIMKKDPRKMTTDAQVSNVLREINRLESGGTGGPSNIVRVYNGENVQNIVVRKSDPEQPQEP